MTVAPVLLVATELVHPEAKSDAAGYLAVAVDNAGRWYLAHALALVALAAAVPAVLGLMHLLRPTRAAGWGHAGAVLAFLGLVPLAAVVGTEFVVWQMTGVDSPAMVTLLDRMMESPGFFVVIAFAVLFPIGWLVLGVGLFLARVVPTWQAALIGLSLPVLFAGDLAYVKPITVIGAIGFLAGLAPLGWRILQQSDDDWETASVSVAARPVPA